MAMTGGDEFPNDEQRAVVDHLEGGLLALAPAGTGKTRVMAERLAAAVERLHVEPRRTLCLTFTNRAAAEVRDRLRARLGPEAIEAPVRTFHGLCAWMLRCEARALGLPRDYVVLDGGDCADALLEALNAMPPVDAARLGAILAGAGARDRDPLARVVSALKDVLPRAKSRADRLELGRAPALLSATGDCALRPVLRLAGWPACCEPGAARCLAREIAGRYHALLAQRHALDFGDLVFFARAMLAQHPDRAALWRNRFDWLQVDEAQDTDPSEYDVVRHLARRAGNLALFGDVDQTIYEWRGCEPDRVVAAFERDFAPVRRLPLARNYRATASLIGAADRVAREIQNRRTSLTPAEGAPSGDPPALHRAPTAAAEAEWVARSVARARAERPGERLGVLASTHARLAMLSAALSARGVPHVTVEEYEFAQRQEVKDGVARLRLIVNPFDSAALRRVAQRPASGIGDQTLARLDTEGEATALRAVDLLRPETHQTGEPFAALLRAWSAGDLAVVDVETTGLSFADDEIVEVAALRLRAGVPAGEFHQFVKPSRPVGESVHVHGLTDEFLAAHGVPRLDALDGLRRFCDRARLVGHNLRFDLTMLRRDMAQAGVAAWKAPYDDTMEIARRLVPLDSCRLAALVEHFQCAEKPGHRADQDVRAAAAVLARLIPPLREKAPARARLVAEWGRAFQPLAAMFAAWREAAGEARPADLLARVLAESGLSRHYRREPERLRNLETLVAFFRRHDRPETPPGAALAEALGAVALAGSAEIAQLEEGRVPVVTVHQAKGLEFDTVFLAGVVEDEFPRFKAVQEKRVEEERRLFYVAVTRARKRLFLSTHALSERGWRREPSRFLRGLAEMCVDAP
ncbi:MAG: UvrD-helicase domain-containing protein [Planctomycetes bacterium]|nr:UvrD-helicase domain-containing protein [Planctomycetota bacterium]